MEEGAKIELTFVDFNIENHNTCAYDFVSGIIIIIIIITSSSASTLLCPVLDTDGSELFKKCGSDAPPKVTSSGNRLTVRFRSDSSVVRRGFKATWRKVAAAGTEGGTIKSENFPSNYPDNKDQVNIYTACI